MLFVWTGLLTVLLLLLVSSIWKGAPYLPTQKNIVNEMLKGVGPGAKLVDLGSGDGRIVIAAAMRGAEAVGFEINPLLVLISRFRIKKSGLSAKVFWKSFWSEDLSGFNFITVFGITKIMPELETKLTKELKPGSTVVSYAFHFPTWPHAEKRGPLFTYKT